MRIAVTTAAVIWILITARDVLQPLAIALLLWLVLSAAVRKIASFVPRRYRRGKATVRVVGGLGVLVVLLAVGLVVGEDIADLRANVALYQANLEGWVSRAGALVGAGNPFHLDDLWGAIDVRQLAINLAGSTASYGAILFVVLIYALFVFVEAERIDAKIAAFAGSPIRERRLRRFLGAVRRGIDDFLGVQVLIGFVQAVPTYLLLLILGVDAPLFFAVLIFLFSFIPTIGTLIGIAFPALMTLLQFDTLGPFFVVLAVLGVIQIFCSNVLATQLMSRSLNLSSLVVLLAVFAGGAVWGVVGALIAVPALTIVAIVCAQDPALRPVAIALSADGRLPAELTTGPGEVAALGRDAGAGAAPAGEPADRA